MLKQILTVVVLAGSVSVPPCLAQTPKRAAPAPRVATWQIDPAHSELSFRIRHLVSRVRGTFGEWGGTLVGDPGSLADGSVEVTINTASIDTNNERRDNHLRSADFFDAAAYPTITFRTRGKQRIGFEASTTINRHDFGVSWNRAAEGGGVLLGDDVEIAIVIAAVQQ